MKKIYSLISCYFFVVFISNISAQNVGVGITTPLSKLHIKGSSNIPQLIIDANTTQTNFFPFLKLRNSNGADRLWIHSDTSFNSFFGLNAGSGNQIINLGNGQSFAAVG